MHEKYTKQSLPERKYCELLGIALCVFNSNIGLAIENILKDGDTNETWYNLIDEQGGKIGSFLLKRLENEGVLGKEIATLFEDVNNARNRIVHSFRITSRDGRQILATKKRKRGGGEQFYITEEYLYDFIKKNEELSSLLYKLREIDNLKY